MTHATFVPSSQSADMLGMTESLPTGSCEFTPRNPPAVEYSVQQEDDGDLD